jgi:hypothetical protein
MLEDRYDGAIPFERMTKHHDAQRCRLMASCPRTASHLPAALQGKAGDRAVRAAQGFGGCEAVGQDR